MRFQFLILAALVLVVVFPMLLLGIGSVAKGWYWPDLLPRQMSNRAWQYVFTPSAGIIPAVSTSLGLAVSVTIGALLVALPAARVLAWREFRGKRVLLFVLLMPVLAPPLAAMMGVHAAFLRLSLSDTLAGVALVHLTQAIPYTILMLTSSLARFDPDFEAQARTLGAPPWYVWRHVTFPAIAPGVLVAGSFAFLISWSQYLSTLLIGGGRIITLPLILVAFQRGSDEAVTAALSIVFLLPAFFVGWLATAHQKIKVGKRNRSMKREIRIAKLFFSILLAAWLFGCKGAPSESEPGIKLESFRSSSWDSIVTRARGSEVRYAMWSGDEARNRFYQDQVSAGIKLRFGITLTLVPTNDVADIVNKLLNEKSAGKSEGGSIDLIWINGENFRTARQASVLWGPFADRLPNVRYYDDQARQRDFGAPIEDYEAPYERAQFVLAYDQARVADPPRSIPALREWILKHPGRFTYIAPPDFTGSAFIRHILLYFIRQAATDAGPSDSETLYQRASAATVEYLNDVKHSLWRGGETYPVSMKEADRLFINNEIDFTMSYGPSFASERIGRGEYPPTVRTFVFEDGTIGNYSFLAIPFNASNAAGAAVVANELMSPSHAIAQGRAMGSLFPMRLDLLSEADRRSAQSLPRGPATLSIEDLSRHQLSEPDAEYLERLEKDWREKVLQR